MIKISIKIEHTNKRSDIGKGNKGSILSMGHEFLVRVIRGLIHKSDFSPQWPSLTTHYGYKKLFICEVNSNGKACV